MARIQETKERVQEEENKEYVEVVVNNELINRKLNIILNTLEELKNR